MPCKQRRWGRKLPYDAPTDSAQGPIRGVKTLESIETDQRVQRAVAAQWPWNWAPLPWGQRSHGPFFALFFFCPRRSILHHVLVKKNPPECPWENHVSGGMFYAPSRPFSPKKQVCYHQAVHATPGHRFNLHSPSGAFFFILLGLPIGKAQQQTRAQQCTSDQDERVQQRGKQSRHGGEDEGEKKTPRKGEETEKQSDIPHAPNWNGWNDHKSERKMSTLETMPAERCTDLFWAIITQNGDLIALFVQNDKFRTILCRPHLPFPKEKQEGLKAMLKTHITSEPKEQRGLSIYSFTNHLWPCLFQWSIFGLPIIDRGSFFPVKEGATFTFVQKKMSMCKRLNQPTKRNFIMEAMLGLFPVLMVPFQRNHLCTAIDFKGRRGKPGWVV